MASNQSARGIDRLPINVAALQSEPSLGYDKSFASEFHDIARGKLFTASLFHGSVQQNVAGLDDDFRLASGTNDTGLLKKLIKSHW